MLVLWVCLYELKLYGESTVPFNTIIAHVQAGLDSLGAVELRNALTAEFGLAMPATLAFDYPTQSAIAQFISAQLVDDYSTSSPARPITALLQKDEKASSTEVLAVACKYPGCANGEK